MISMEIAFDTRKVKKNGKYTLSDILEKLNNVMENNGITRKDKNGFYVGNEDDKDLGRFICAIGDLREEEWFFPFLKKWMWYVDNSRNDMLKHYLAQGYKR